jgi:hypothetical protein
VFPAKVEIAPRIRAVSFSKIAVLTQALSTCSCAAIAADETRLRREFSGANIRRRFLHDFLRLVQLLRVPRGLLPLIALQVMKHQPQRLQLQNLLRCQRVQTQLQIFLRV